MIHILKYVDDPEKLRMIIRLYHRLDKKCKELMVKDYEDLIEMRFLLKVYKSLIDSINDKSKRRVFNTIGPLIIKLLSNSVIKNKIIGKDNLFEIYELDKQLKMSIVKSNQYRTYTKYILGNIVDNLYIESLYLGLNTYLSLLFFDNLTLSNIFRILIENKVSKYYLEKIVYYLNKEEYDKAKELSKYLLEIAKDNIFFKNKDIIDVCNELLCHYYDVSWKNSSFVTIYGSTVTHKYKTFLFIVLTNLFSYITDLGDKVDNSLLNKLNKELLSMYEIIDFKRKESSSTKKNSS